MVDMQKARALAKRINDMTGDGTHTIGDVVAALGLALGLTVVPAETEDEAQGAIRARTRRTARQCRQVPAEQVAGVASSPIGHAIAITPPAFFRGRTAAAGLAPCQA